MMMRMMITVVGLNMMAFVLRNTKYFSNMTAFVLNRYVLVIYITTFSSRNLDLSKIGIALTKILQHFH